MPKHSLLITEIPDDARAVILTEQAKHQIKCSCRFSKEKTVLKIIRNWGKIKDFRVNNVPVSKMVEEMG